jgi:hypothetical protein
VRPAHPIESARRCRSLALGLSFIVLSGCGDAPLHAPTVDDPREATKKTVVADERRGGRDARAGEDHIRLATGPPIPMHTADGRYMVSFVVHGVVGGRVNGSILQYDAEHKGARSGGADPHLYLVDDGVLLRTDSGYRFALHGRVVAAREDPARTRRFSSELSLRTGDGFEDGDVWTIDDLTCTYDQGDLICI